MICDPEDIRILREIMKNLNREARDGRDVAELVLAAGRYFLGAPYAAASLEHRPEILTINLREFDCFTFVENAVVLARLVQRGRTGFPAYAAALQAIRYRKGLIAGYPSRLHYFTDWIYENSRRGILKDLTRNLGGRSFRKKIYHMTSHRDEYPALQTDEHCRAMEEIERRISRRLRHEIPREKVPTMEDRITGGDLVAILTDQDGLDCLHAGLAIRTRGRLHLLHASRKTGAVVISPETLCAYLSGSANRSGILVARVSDHPR